MEHKIMECNFNTKRLIIFVNWFINFYKLKKIEQIILKSMQKLNKLNKLRN